jgi:hypothetical protein
MSLSAAVVAELVAAGLKGEALVAACERIEAAAPLVEDSRTKRQDRNRRYYVSKRLKASYSDVSDANSDAPRAPYTEDAHAYAEPEPNITTTPPTSEASASSAGAPAADFGDAENVIPIVKPNPRGSRLPANWWPPPECEAWCREKFHLNDHELSEAVDEFRDFWSSAPGDRGRKCDWPATFRNACRKRFGQARRPSAARHGQAGSGRLAAYQRAAAHFSAPHDVPGERTDLSDHRGRVLDL